MRWILSLALFLTTSVAFGQDNEVPSEMLQTLQQQKQQLETELATVRAAQIVHGMDCDLARRLYRIAHESRARTLRQHEVDKTALAAAGMRDSPRWQQEVSETQEQLMQATAEMDVAAMDAGRAGEFYRDASSEIWRIEGEICEAEDAIKMLQDPGVLILASRCTAQLRMRGDSRHTSWLSDGVPWPEAFSNCPAEPTD